MHLSRIIPAIVLTIIFCGVSFAADANSPATTNIAVSIDVLTDRHPISQFVYGGAYPQSAAAISDSGLSVVRWGGNGTSTYNWKLFTDNADNDYFFEDFGYSEIGDSDSIKYIQDVKAAGSYPIMTMVMLPWVAQSAENNNGHWSFSVAKYGAQCATDPYNPDAGDGLKTDCATVLQADPNDAYYPLLDQPGSNDPPNSVYRNQWTQALAAAFGMRRISTIWTTKSTFGAQRTLTCTRILRHTTSCATRM